MVASIFTWILMLIFGTTLLRILGTLQVLLFGGMTYVGMRLYFVAMDGNWADLVDVSALNMKMESVLIPMVDEVHLSGIFLSQKHSGHDPAPTVIIHHGVLGKKENAFDLAVPLVSFGYQVLVIDARGHGETQRNYPAFSPDDWYITEDTGIFPDLARIIDYVVSRKDVDVSRIALLGISMGGGLALTRGLQDDRIKLNIALCPFWSWKSYLQSERAKKVFTEPWVTHRYINFHIKARKILNFDKYIAPRYFLTQDNAPLLRSRIRLIHARNDTVLNYDSHFLPLQNLLKLPPDHVLVLEEGDHFLRGQETVVVSQVKKWLDEVFQWT